MFKSQRAHQLFSKGDFLLIADSKPESKLARKHLQDFNLPFREKRANSCIKDQLYYSSPVFSNTFEESDVPFLLVYHYLYHGPFSYISLEGVRSLLRDKKRVELNGGTNHFYWEDIKTFYYMGREREKLVTCFDEDKQVIFTGDIERSPYPLSEVLDSHDFNQWYDVGCWFIGDFRELLKKQSDGLIIDEETKTVLFPEEVMKLKKRKKIVTQDSRSAYNVTFESYFLDKGKLYGVYANMVD